MTKTERGTSEPISAATRPGYRGFIVTVGMDHDQDRRTGPGAWQSGCMFPGTAWASMALGIGLP
eukprot:9144482-Pyramimonas_sp.AAC.1